VQTLLGKRYSPAQIAGALAATYPDRPELQVSHETIFKALYVQGRGELRRELTKCLRTGRALRKPRRRTGVTDKRGRIPGMVNISERAAEADERRGRPLGISMVLSSRLSHWRRCCGPRSVLAQQRPEDVDAAPRQGDDSLAVGSASGSLLEVVVTVGSGAHHAGLRG
jgi:hypothetical protein